MKAAPIAHPPYDVAGVGNAIVDVLSFCDEEFVATHQLGKGTMELVDEARAATLYNKIGPSTECSGGSVANSLAALASLGAKTAFIGKTSADAMGTIFSHDMRTVGVHFATDPAQDGPATASCLVFVTPDAQRTMATYIGACSLVSESDIDETIIKSSAITYIEGYLWDTENAKAAIRKAVTLARQHGNKVAFTLSDVFCVDRHRAEFLHLIQHYVDIVFANEAELKSLYKTDDIEKAISEFRGLCSIAAVTRSEKGSIVLTRDERVEAPAEKVDKIIDTTGAGDLYAAGFLFGQTRGWDLKKCALLGNRCAGRIITQLGARSMTPLQDLVE